MWKKSAIRALMKYIPQSAELRDALADDDDAIAKTTPQAPEIKMAKVAADSAAAMLGSASAPEPKEAAAAKTVQDSLEDFVTNELKMSFDAFFTGAVENGWISDSEPATTFSEFNSEFCEKILSNKSMTKATLVSEDK